MSDNINNSDTRPSTAGGQAGESKTHLLGGRAGRACPPPAGRATDEVVRMRDCLHARPADACPSVIKPFSCSCCCRCCSSGWLVGLARPRRLLLSRRTFNLLLPPALAHKKSRKAKSHYKCKSVLAQLEPGRAWWLKPRLGLRLAASRWKPVAECQAMVCGLCTAAVCGTYADGQVAHGAHSATHTHTRTLARRRTDGQTHTKALRRNHCLARLGSFANPKPMASGERRRASLGKSQALAAAVVVVVVVANTGQPSAQSRVFQVSVCMC
ncbi:Hypothetical predicted protein [Olea europaea subsp. europaea]|uniref:Uncharacterized protein n=1 Tax=Olea europaea subsp. europaea TaxID=158383 RepID=A0A8S0UF03_OLEEU|nr:Hypothetical predicted protein [Olea europaea subsp. europaea]